MDTIEPGAQPPVSPPSPLQAARPVLAAAIEGGQSLPLAEPVEIEVAIAALPVEGPRGDAALGSGQAPAAPEERLAIVAPPPKPTAAPQRDERAYVPQISDTARTAYIAQLNAESASGQRLAVRIGGELVGEIAFQVSDGTVSVDIGQLLDVFQSRFEPARFAALRGSSAAGQLVSLERVREAGIPLRYDPVYDELVLASQSG